MRGIQETILHKTLHLLNDILWGELSDREYKAGQEAFDEVVAAQKKITQYEDFLHAINYAVTAGNQARLKHLIDNAFKWGYAHRCGNGENTDEEQQRIIDKCAENLARVPDEG